MSSPPQNPSGSADGPDPVNVTSAPIREEERGELAASSAPADRPFPWLMGAALVAIVALAIVAAVTVGAQYAIPFALIAVIVAVFVGTNRGLSLLSTRRHGEGEDRDAQAADADDPVPSFGFDEESQLGQTSELSDEQQQSHADMERSPGT